MSLGSILITVIYATLLAWGFGVGVQVLWQGFRRPGQLLNPLFGNRWALRLFALHIVVVSLDLFLVGPLAVANKSTLWYWGSRVAVLSSSLPLAAFLNRNPQSFGKLIGRWVVFRNVFEVGLHVWVASKAVNWFHYYLLLWWIVAYRYLDVGPRRLLQKLYGTPERLAARPWAPRLNWAVIAVLYGLSFLAVYHRQVFFADVPGDQVAAHVAEAYEVAIVMTVNVVVAVLAWILTKKYTRSLLDQAAERGSVPPVGEIGAH